jgi:hypothetical protein
MTFLLIIIAVVLWGIVVRLFWFDRVTQSPSPEYVSRSWLANFRRSREE